MTLAYLPLDPLQAQHLNVIGRQVISDEVRAYVFTTLMVLLAIQLAIILFGFWKFNSHKEVMEFLQEKVNFDLLPLSQKQSSAYTNLLTLI